MAKRSKVILVDENDCDIGLADKEVVHKEGLLHRAFSIFIMNDKEEMLIHKRADSKYHSAGLWTNCCCSHPLPDEPLDQSAVRRLKEEMGFSTDLDYQFSFLYKETLGNGLIEHEFDHIFFGMYNGKPDPNPDEVSDWRFVSMDDLQNELDEQPERFTAWFNLLFTSVRERLGV